MRRRLAPVLVTIGLAVGLTASAPAAAADGKRSARQAEQAAAVMAVARATFREQRLRAAILTVRVGGREIVTRALGNSMLGVRATPSMHFRNGNVAIGYMTTILLQLQEEGALRIDQPLSRWLPKLPSADRITLRMLANSTSGYSDYVRREEFDDAFNAYPFRNWKSAELIRLGTSRIEFPAGTSFDYSHTGFAILGEVLRKVTGKPLWRLIRERVLRPLRLRETRSSQLPAIPRPALHSYTSERGAYEESTYWSSNWGTARGANMTSDIADVARSAAAIGSGRMLSKRSHRLQTGPVTAGLGGTTKRLYYGMGMPVMGGWVSFNPWLAGYGVMASYLPSRRLTIAAVTTPSAGAEVSNHSEELVRRIAARLAPRHPIPERP